MLYSTDEGEAEQQCKFGRIDYDGNCTSAAFAKQRCTLHQAQYEEALPAVCQTSRSRASAMTTLIIEEIWSFFQRSSNHYVHSNSNDSS